MFGIILSVQDFAKDAQIVNAISAYISFLNAKEFAGQERALGSKAFAEGFARKTLSQLVELIHRQHVHMEVFRSYATDDEIKLLEKTLSDPAFVEVQRMRDVAIAGNAIDPSVSGIDGEYWFEKATERIDLLKNVEDQIASDVITLAKDTANKASRDRNVTLVFVLLIFSLIAAGAYKISRNIVGGITSLTEHMQDIANGNLAIQISRTTHKDEIGQMARTLEVFKINAIERQELQRQSEADHFGAIRPFQ